MEELAGYHAMQLMGEHPVEPGPRILRCVLQDKDAVYLKLLALRLVVLAPQCFVLLAATQEEPARIVVAASADLNVHCGNLLREALAVYGVKGGGSPGVAQGQISNAHLDALFTRLEAAVRRA